MQHSARQSDYSNSGSSPCCMSTNLQGQHILLRYSKKPDVGPQLIYNYPPMGRWIVVDIYRDAKRRGIYPLLFTNPEGDSCFSIYQIRWIKKCFFNFFFWNFRETTRHLSLRSQNSEYPRIFQVTGANQNARKLLSTDLVNTKMLCLRFVCYLF